jgi:hypothetical protein
VCQAAVVDVQLLAMLPHIHDHMEMGTSDTIYQLTQQSNALVSSQLTGTPSRERRMLMHACLWA